MRKFVSNSILSLNVVLDNGSSVHVSFNPQSGGGSVFYCDDALANAMRNHYKFGRSFREVAVPVVEPVAVVAEAVEKKEESKAKELSFACNDDAKDYLADAFGASRSKMRTRSAIEAIAKSHGLTIVWTE